MTVTIRVMTRDGRVWGFCGHATASAFIAHHPGATRCHPAHSADRSPTTK